METLPCSRSTWDTRIIPETWANPYCAELTPSSRLGSDAFSSHSFDSLLYLSAYFVRSLHMYLSILEFYAHIL